MKMAWYILFSFILFVTFPSEFLLVILYFSFYQDDARSNHLVKRDQPSKDVGGAAKRDTGKATKKAGMCCISIGPSL